MVNLLNVSIEVFFPAETIRANITFERFYVTMRHYVKFELVKPMEFFRAIQVVFKWTLVFS